MNVYDEPQGNLAEFFSINAAMFLNKEVILNRTLFLLPSYQSSHKGKLFHDFLQKAIALLSADS